MHVPAFTHMASQMPPPAHVSLKIERTPIAKRGAVDRPLPLTMGRPIVVLEQVQSVAKGMAKGYGALGGGHYDYSYRISWTSATEHRRGSLCRRT